MIEEGQNECPNPESHSTIFHRVPFCPPEVALGSGFHRLGTGAVELRDFVSAATGRLKQALGADW